MLKIGDRVTLNEDAPDDNTALQAGDAGIILHIRNNLRLTVRWDKYSEAAESNNDLIEDFFEVFDHADGDDDWEYNNNYSDNEGHLWIVGAHQVTLLTPFTPFRKKKGKESAQEYKINAKIYQLDTKWKERHANPNCIPLQNKQHKCPLPG